MKLFAQSCCFLVNLGGGSSKLPLGFSRDKLVTAPDNVNVRHSDTQSKTPMVAISRRNRMLNVQYVMSTNVPICLSWMFVI